MIIDNSISNVKLKFKKITLESMKALLLKLSIPALLMTGCTNVTVQAPQQVPQQAAVPTVVATKTSSEPATPVATPAAIEVSAPAAPTRSTSSSCNYYAGRAVEGQSVNVDLCSVSPKSSGAIAFVYTLGSKRMESEADCTNVTWRTFYDGQTHRPQSLATEKMINRVCGNRELNQISSQSTTSQSGAAIVFDPPSNVRVSPNGAIICSSRGEPQLTSMAPSVHGTKRMFAVRWALLVQIKLDFNVTFQNTAYLFKHSSQLSSS
jgi:hypothetical protein